MWNVRLVLLEYVEPALEVAARFLVVAEAAVYVCRLLDKLFSTT